MIYSFFFFLLLFVVIGVSSIFYSRHSRQDYYLASHSVPSWLVGLSAVATNNSGYMFIGVIGYTYVTGLAAIWLMVGWIAGDFLASMFIHKRLRQAAIDTDEASYAGVLGHWGGVRFKTFQRLASILSLVFLLSYAAAQLVAGGKALQVLFGWPNWGGAVMGSALVVMYCFAGGIRASIWTDAAQSFVMILAMGLLLVTATVSLGGVDQSIADMHRIEGFMDWFPRDLAVPGLSGGVLFALSWMFAGLSVIGQPHVMVRFMALKGKNSMISARAWYYGWYILFYAMATGVGLLSRIYLPDSVNFDAELALPTMARQLLPPALVGLILAGMFAATMSTADSLVLSCSASITHDLLPHKIEKTWLLKAATIGITSMALLWALLNRQSVFSLVIMAWSTLASAFAPLLIVLALGGRPAQRLYIWMLLVGTGTALAWRWFGLHNAVYEGMPGILAGLLVFGISAGIKKTLNKEDLTEAESPVTE